MPADHAKVRPLVVANARHSPRYSCALRLGACRAWAVDSENRPQRGQFLPNLQPHSPAMGQRDGEKWTAAVDSQPTLPESDRLQDRVHFGALPGHARKTHEETPGRSQVSSSALGGPGAKRQVWGLLSGSESLRVFRSLPLITPKCPRSSLQMLAIARAMAALCA